jgi:hypothetical protein
MCKKVPAEADFGGYDAQICRTRRGLMVWVRKRPFPIIGLSVSSLRSFVLTVSIILAQPKIGGLMRRTMPSLINTDACAHQIR